MYISLLKELEVFRRWIYKHHTPTEFQIFFPIRGHFTDASPSITTRATVGTISRSVA